VYSHLPEHTLQLKNAIINNTNMEPRFIGYTHWTEFPEITNYSMTMMDVNFLGILEMDKCGINTQGQKKLILKNARSHFNDKVVKRLDEILEPQYLGWEIPKYENQTTDKKIIVFNHRPHTYKNYPWFLEQMDKLWEQRKDFEVWVPLADSTEGREYLTNDKYDRFGYFSKLSSCYIGVCAKQKYSGWAVSATDGMSVGVPYLFLNADYYCELASSAGIYYDNNDFLEKLEEVLDDVSIREEYSKRSLDRFEECKWESAITQFNNMLDKTILNLKTIKQKTDSYKKIVDFIHTKKSVTKKDIIEHLGWGVRIGFSGYRNKLRQEPTIKFTKDRYETTNS